ncbi:MAG TPA: glycosidase [Candidatus Paceibacterota bacterium]|nr:glycosidase [Candidatus Paceibacterota bacterium]
MNNALGAATLIAGVAVGGMGLVAAFIAIACGIVTLLWWWLREHKRPLSLRRFNQNPILGPDPSHWWESEAVFNPAAFTADGKVHILYRAMGRDGISRIGYASSEDGVRFTRLPYPVYSPDRGFGVPRTDRVYGPLSYSQTHYASGGGWGGIEDPRAIKIDGKLYMSFVAFDGWGFVRMALTSMPLPKFLNKDWQWKKAAFLSPPNEIHKNWVLFPERVGGRYAVLHSITPKISIEYVDSLESFDDEDTYIHSPGRSGGRPGEWDSIVRGAGAPPIRTSEGWLLLYHGMDANNQGIGYKVGAMLLDLEDPTRVLYRSSQPILVPSEWYENDWKPGVIIATGAVVIGDDLMVYYGGGDKYVAAARANLRDFLRRLKYDEQAELEPVKLQV